MKDKYYSSISLTTLMDFEIEKEISEVIPFWIVIFMIFAYLNLFIKQTLL